MSKDFLLLRGLAREQGHWGDFTDKLLKVSGVNSVHCVDLPGNGQYFKISSPVSIGEMAEFVHSHNPIAASGKPVVLLAISMGAMVAIELLALYPESYEGAFLMNTSLSGLSPVYQRLKPQALESFYRVLRSGTAREKEEHIYNMVSNRTEGKEALLEEWTRLAHGRPTHITNAMRQLVAAGRYRLPKVKPLPPIHLMASRGDNMVDCQCSLELARVWDLPIALHESAGHEITVDDGDWVCETLRGWLKKSPNGSASS